MLILTRAIARLASLGGVVALTALFGCDEGRPAEAPSGGGAGGAGGNASGGTGTGPLAQLESSAVQPETWLGEDGKPLSFLYYPRENVRLSASCRTPAGPLVCDAMRFMRSGMPVEIARRALDGRTSAGVKACMKMNQPIVVVHNSVNAEDSFCRFPDGSLISNGALEQYAIRVIQ